MKTILSIFDYTGNWSKPYKENNYNVIQIDIKLGLDILEYDYKKLKNVHGILIAMPCTDYALSGAKHFARKDIDGTTDKSQVLVKRIKEIIDYFNSEFWVIENPMTRIHRLNPWIGELKYKFNPCDFAGYGFESDRYNKQTWLFGNFNKPVKNRLEPLEKDYPGFKNFGGKSEKTKELRSITPLGFSYAFFNANI